ncbi:MAG: cbb3-type cytochrome oxidase assembly protein CcoS [Phycisphaerales bacterium]|jgi:cbb3-type cytochrome oxidase maturation protein|nr:cbb3-type cytochrome oxidase assembly protein CcoS [Phycisphaerales bacterium]
MSVLYLMVPMALVLGIGAVIAFIWASKTGQYDDVDSPAHRMLHDDPPDPQATDTPGNKTNSRTP